MINSRRNFNDKVNPQLSQLPQQNTLRIFNSWLSSIVGGSETTKGRLVEESFQNEM
jgi:hypothetical protein